MSVFKDFPGLENLEKNARTFKDLQGPTRALHTETFTETQHNETDRQTHTERMRYEILLDDRGKRVRTTCPEFLPDSDTARNQTSLIENIL